MKPGTLLVRADASAEIGTGHLMRCMALGQAWSAAGGEVVFLSSSGAAKLEARLTRFGAGLVVTADGGVSQTIDLARERTAQWAVIDGYHLGAPFAAELVDAGLRVLLIDDEGGQGPYRADFVLNQNIAVDESLYGDREDRTRLLLGPRYALLRREFERWREWRRNAADGVDHVLLTFGGSDPDNLTMTALGAVTALQPAIRRVTAMVGPENPHADSVRRAAGGDPDVEVVHAPPDVAPLMAAADVALAAAGTTVWELSFMMVPAVLVSLAANQDRNARGLARAGVAIEADSPSREGLARALQVLVDDPGQRREMAARGRSLVDGLGSARVVEAMVEHS